MAELILNVSLNDQATAGLKEIDKKVAELGDKETKLKVGVDTIGVTQGARTVNNALAQTEGTIGKISISLANMLKIKAFQTITSEIRSSLTEMKAVDDELVTVRKVANATDAELKSLNDRAYNVGSQYGMKASDYLSAVADFTRAGYKDLAGDLGELAVKTQLVGDVSQNVATQMLLSVDTAYQYQGSVEKLSAVLDGMNEIDNNFATSIEKISTGLGKVAPIAAQAHVGVDELSAAIGTITAVTQRSGEEAATALRALFLNIIGDTKTEIADGATWTAGEIEGLHDVLVKYAPAAVEAAEATGKVINPMEAIGGLSQSMKDGLLTEQELMSMVSDIGGKLRTSQLLAIIQNWDMYKDMLTSFGTAAGSADKEVSNAMDSWTRKSEILSNSVTKLMNNLLDSKAIKQGLDLVTELVNALDTGIGRATIQAVGFGVAATGIAKTLTSIGKLFSGGFGAAGWIGVVAAGISVIASVIDAVTVSYEELQQKVQETRQSYETEKSKLEDIGSQLEENKKKIEDIKALGPITYSDQKQLKQLEDENEQLEKRYEIQQKLVDLKLQEAAEAATELMDAYTAYDENVVNAMIESNKQYGDTAIALESTKDINEVIALYEHYSKLKKDLLNDQEDLDADQAAEQLELYNEKLTGLEKTLLELADDYQTYLNDTQEAYEKIAEKSEEDLNSKEKKLVLEREIAKLNRDEAYERLGKIQEESDAKNGRSYPETEFTNSINEQIDKLQQLRDGTVEGTSAWEKYNGQITNLTKGLEDFHKAQDIAIGAFGERENVSLEDIEMFAAKMQQTFGQTDAWGAGLVDFLNQTYVAASQVNDFSGAIENNTKCLELVKKAQQEVNEIGGITANTYKDLTDAGIDLSDSVLRQGDVYKVAQGTLEEYREQFEDFAGKWDVEPDTSGVDAFTAALKNALAAQEALEKKLKEAGESGDAYRGYADYFKQFDNLYQNNGTGTKRFAEIFNLIANSSVKAQVGKDAKAAAEWFYSETATGLREAAAKGGGEFVKYVYEKGFAGTKNAVFKNGKQYAIDYDLIDYKKLSEETGYAEDVLRAFFGVADEGNSVMKDTSDATDNTSDSFKKLADNVATAENGVKKVKFTDYAKEAAKAGKSVKEIQDDIAKLGKEDSGFKLEMDVDSADAESVIQQYVEDAQAATEAPYVGKLDYDTSPAAAAKASAESMGEEFASQSYTAKLGFTVSGMPGLPFGFKMAATGTDDADAGPTLVNELGPELIAQDGKAFIAGGGRPTIVNLKKGAIVYNHLETEALLQGQKMGEEGIASKAKGTSNGIKFTPIKLPSKSGTSQTFPSGIDAIFDTSGKDDRRRGGGGGNKASSGAEEEEETPDWWKIVEDYYKRATDEANRAIDRLDYRLELIKNDWDDLKEPLDKEVDALDRANDQLDRQATLLERERDKLTKPLNDQIDAMEKAKDIQDEQLELAEKQKAVEEARNELQNAQNERTIRYFNTEKGQWEWMADKGRVKDAQDALADAEKDLADFEYDMQIKALERQVSEIEDAYQKQLDAIEEQQTANEDRIYELEQQLQALEDYYEAAMEPLEKQQKELERKLAAIEEQWAEAEMPYTKPEGNLSDALNNIGGSSEENQAVRDILSKAQGNAGDSLNQTKTDETTAPFTKEAAKAIQEALYREYGIQFGAFDSSNASSTQTVTQAQNNIVNNNGTTLVVNGITISGDFKTMTIGDLISDLGIYAGQ